MTLIWMAAILDLSNMAPTAGAQLGSREKSKLYDLGYKCSKFGAFGTIWTIIWLNALGPYYRMSYDISLASDWSRLLSRPIRSLRYIVTCTRIRAPTNTYIIKIKLTTILKGEVSSYCCLFLQVEQNYCYCSWLSLLTMIYVHMIINQWIPFHKYA